MPSTFISSETNISFNNQWDIPKTHVKPGAGLTRERMAGLTRANSPILEKNGRW
jgi:hypothetical protein